MKNRYKMLQLVCGDKIKAENVELNRKETLDTLQAFNLIEEKYKNDATEIFYIMGADNFEKLPNWKDSKKLVEDYQYIIFKRDGSNLEQCIEKNQILKKNRQNFKFLDLQQYADISSGIIRELIKKEDYEKCKEYTDAAIVQYIKENKLYL